MESWESRSACAAMDARRPLRPQKRNSRQAGGNGLSGRCYGSCPEAKARQLVGDPTLACGWLDDDRNELAHDRNFSPMRVAVHWLHLAEQAEKDGAVGAATRVSNSIQTPLVEGCRLSESPTTAMCQASVAESSVVLPPANAREQPCPRIAESV